jgi:hypothetical protein
MARASPALLFDSLAASVKRREVSSPAQRTLQIAFRNSHDLRDAAQASVRARLQRAHSPAHVDLRMGRVAPKLNFGLTGGHQLRRAHRVPVSHTRRVVRALLPSLGSHP